MSTPVRRAIYGNLAGDSTLNNLLGTPAPGRAKSIYYQQALQGAHFPFVIMSKQSGFPTEAFGDPSAMENDVWLVKGIGRDSDDGIDTVESIAARIIALLNDTALSISGATLLYLRRESDVEYPEVEEGVLYRHAGSLFRLVTD
jgi:hypothetical protein